MKFFVTVLVLLALGVTLTACGNSTASTAANGGANDDDYRQAVLDELDEMNDEACDVDTSAPMAETMNDLADAFADASDRIRDIEAPSKWDDAHDSLVDDIDDLAEGMSDIADGVGDGDKPGPLSGSSNGGPNAWADATGADLPPNEC